MSACDDSTPSVDAPSAPNDVGIAAPDLSPSIDLALSPPSDSSLSADQSDQSALADLSIVDSALAPSDLFIADALASKPDLAPIDVPLPSISGLSLWLRSDKDTFQDAAGTTAAVATGDPIGRWKDQSGNGDDALQMTAASRPVLRTSQLNGRSAVCLTAPQLLALTKSIPLGDHTIFAVINPDFSIIPAGVLLGGTNTFVLGFLRTVGVSYVRSMYFAGGTGVLSTRGMPVGGWMVASSDRAGATWSPRLNGEALSLGMPVAATMQPLSQIGSYQTTHFNGCVAEILVYNRALTAAERDGVRGYLAARYDLVGEAPPRVMYNGGPLGNYNMTPTTISLADGNPPTLLTAFRNGPHHVNRGEILAMTSRDSGATWTTPVIAASDPVNDVRTNNGMLRLANGTILLPVIEEKEGAGQTFTVVGSYVTRSSDGGQTWSPLTAIANPSNYDWFFSYGTIVVRADGALLMPGYGQHSGTHFWDALLMISTDKGMTWTLQGVIAAGTSSLVYSETAIVYQGATLVAAARENNALSLWLTTSTDDGKTWKSPGKLGWGVSPVFLTLSDGRILFSYTIRADVPGVYARILHFDAKGAVDIPGMQKTADYPFATTGTYAVGLGYPAPVEFQPGRVFVNYYSELNGGDISTSQIWARDFDISSLGQ